MRKLIPLRFFYRDSTVVGPKLIGKVLAIRRKGKIQRFYITETEAYQESDPASHSHVGVTERTRVMFEDGGHIYIYFIYGMYFCMNFVTGKKHDGQAVLIRALAPLDPKIDPRACAGPGKLCRFLGIDRKWNGVLLTRSSGVWLEDHGKKPKLETSRRIGISKAKHRPWRWHWKNHSSVSR